MATERDTLEASSHLDRSANWLNIYPARTQEERDILLEFDKSLGNFPDTKEIVLTLYNAIEIGSHANKNLSQAETDLFKAVLDFITKGVALGLDVPVSLQERVTTDSENKKSLREEAQDAKDPNLENFSYYNGDYRGSIINEGPASINLLLRTKDYIPHQQPGDTVHFLKNRLETLLDLKPDKPVVLVDIGAMYASTLLELAEVFKNRIESGELVLIATNLALSRQLIESAPKPRNGQLLYQNYQKKFNEFGHLIHFVVSDVGQLDGLTLPLPNGAQITLSVGSIDIAHENWSITAHSYSLEKDIADLATLVGASGLIMSRSYDPIRGPSSGLRTYKTELDHLFSGEDALLELSDAFGENPDYQLDGYRKFQLRSVRTEMRRAAIATLQERGFKQVSSVRVPERNREYQLNYTFYMGKDTSSLKLFTDTGQEVSLVPLSGTY